MKVGHLSIFQPLVSPSAKLSSLIFLHQKGQTYRFDRLKFIQIYANWKSKEWNVQEHKNNVGHHFAICAVLALLQRKVQPSGEKTWKNLCYKSKYHKGFLPISYLCSRTFDRGKKCLILSQQDGLKVQNLRRVLAFPQQVKWSKACFFRSVFCNLLIPICNAICPHSKCLIRNQSKLFKDLQIVFILISQLSS